MKITYYYSIHLIYYLKKKKEKDIFIWGNLVTYLAYLMNYFGLYMIYIVIILNEILLA